MLQLSTGKCNCYFCVEGTEHRATHTRWDNRKYLLVAESLDPKDFVSTRVCMTCGHEELA